MILGKMKVYLEQNDNLSVHETYSLELLYAPLLSLEALRLYSYLSVMSQLNHLLDYSTISSHLNFDMDVIENSRKELERLWLIQTFEQDNQHFIRIKKPLDYHAFKNHEILGRLFINEFGTSAIQEIISLLIGQRFDGKQNDISEKLTSEVLDNYDSQKEMVYKEVVSMSQSQSFNMKSFLNICGETIFPKHLRTKENLSLIAGYADAYQIDYNSLKRYINESIPVDQSRFDSDNFKSLSTINHQPLPKGDPYSWPPEKFLAQLQDGVPVINADLYLIKDLKEKFKFSNEVINTLLDYVIKNHDGSLARNLVEKIATSWKRAKVNSKNQALALINNETKKIPQKRSRTVIKKAHDERPQDIELDPAERQKLIDKIRGIDNNEK